MDKRKIYTVTEVAQKVQRLLEDSLGSLWVEGEISNLSAPSSGHIYFDLKDKTAVIPVAFFKGFHGKLKFELENGLHVICYGKITSYAPQGKYQIRAEHLEPKGLGALMLAFNRLKEKLEKEGLFDQEHKKPIPYLPQKIGIVTSISGAAVRDIIKVLRRRFNNMHILIYSVRVQGDYAPSEIAGAIRAFNAMNDPVDVLIVGRGGGSIEDLWAFNEEEVARAIFASKIPVISAVGHERDWTIADWVADLRAPTPSAAAELVVKRKDELGAAIDQYNRAIRRSLFDIVDRKREFLKQIQGRYGLLRLKDIVPQRAQRLDELKSLLDSGLNRVVKNSRQNLDYLLKHIENLNPLSILSRGYSLVEEEQTGRIVKDVKDIKLGSSVLTRLHRGSFISRVEKKNTP